VRLQAQLEGAEIDGSPESRALRESVAHRFDQVGTALARLDEGKYGICTDCLQPIQADRLVIQPFATRCVSCQGQADRRSAARI
jgi:RNA polymerase-binding transcription factor DksA